jgi:hypothetical protein
MYSLDRQHVYQKISRVGRTDTYVADDTVSDGEYGLWLWLWFAMISKGYRRVEITRELTRICFLWLSQLPTWIVCLSYL